MGEEALETIRNNPDLSAVLLDIVMPVMDGLETLEQIKRGADTICSYIFCYSGH